MSRGFFTIAQGDVYLRAAYAMALSLKLSQADSKLAVGITPGAIIPDQYKAVFDCVVDIPWKDHAADSTWKLENEWKAIYMTPYDHTIKLDADMLFFSDLSPWWEILEKSEGVFATNVLSYRNEVSNNMTYRETWVDNDLPNIYTAFFYFQNTPKVFELFKLAEEIYNNWERYFMEFLVPNSRPTFVSTDVVFALAAKILGFTELNQHPHIDVPTFVHMKTQLQGWGSEVTSEEWTKLLPQYFTPDCVLKIGNYTQTFPFHYHQKQFLTDEMIGYLEKKVGV
jgi:hypothetical protein